MPSILILLGLIGIARSSPPEVSCPVPLSPEHGQSFLYHNGHVVKYACEPGFVLKGKEIVRCIDGEWEDLNPTCVPFGDELTDIPTEDDSETLPPVPPSRPLFDWDSNRDSDEEQENNSTSEETPLSDEARVRLLLYPRRRAPLVSSRVRASRLQSASELEEEEKRRSENGRKTVYLESPPPPPSVIYVRRTIIPGKSETSRKALEDQYKSSPLHMKVEDGRDTEMVVLPRAAVVQNDKGQQYDDYWRQLYWYNHYGYPRSASLAEYRNGAPVVVTLTDSQLAWINSLHPELRDQYLRDMYVVRAEDAAEGQRAQAVVRRYEDAYNYDYHHQLPYMRRPVSPNHQTAAASFDFSCNSAGNTVVAAPSLPNMHVARYDSRKNVNPPHNYYLAAVYQCDPGHYMMDARFSELYCMITEDPASRYDYSCHQSGQPFVKAPKLHNMQVARYDRRQNPNQPRNHYLTAIYRCNPGFTMLDTRFTELHCSNKQWVGVRPFCVRRG